MRTMFAFLCLMVVGYLVDINPKPPPPDSMQTVLLFWVPGIILCFIQDVKEILKKENR
jgi:hypothetical protein